ncbi:MAG: S8 family serine peptidase, partial [Rhodothermales bacterium]
MKLYSRVVLVLPVLLLVLLSSRPAVAQPIPKYWIFLDGKQNASTIEVSEHATRRRLLRGARVDPMSDAGISPSYSRILAEKGIEVVVESRWLNAVSAYLTDDMLSEVNELSFVTEVRRVARLVRSNVVFEPTYDAHPLLDYGLSRRQLEDINAIEPLENGFNGTGVVLGFLDTPFHDFAHEVFESHHEEGRIIADSNFVGNPDDPSTHGFNVASIAAGFKEGQLIGPGHGASILAATTEFTPTETNEEEDFFVAGMEWLEVMGADVVNVSLGYTTFDSGQRDYTASDLDGDTGLTTRAADLAASLGVVVVAAAGNESVLRGLPCTAHDSPTGCWYHISTPADGDSVIAVGAVNPDSSRASFSGRGPTADERIKPDVAAPGVSVRYATASGLYSSGNGTSFAAPLVAGVVAQILQANPLLNPIEVRDILRQTASQADNPDNSLGWGIINAAAAVNTAIALSVEGPPEESAPSVQVYPNPATDELFIFINADRPGPARIDVYDVLGRQVLSTVDRSIGSRTFRLQVGSLHAGVFFYT